MPTAGLTLIGLIEGTYSLCVRSWNEGWHKILPGYFIIKGKFYANYFDDELQK